MDDAVRARNAAREALADIEPAQLRDTLFDRLDDASMTPGVLTLLSARALDPGVTTDAIVERAAGVQLIYEGLRLTRALAREEPWAALDTAADEADAAADGAGSTGDGTGVTADDDAGFTEAGIAADLDIVAADVLVSRGFYLLARTEAADHAVEAVRGFGRDQTRRREADADAVALDRNLEADVFELAVVAGTTAVGTDPPTALVDRAGALAREFDGDLPPASSALSGLTLERIAALSGAGSDESGGDRVRSSATDP